jgi:hypothetical protein
MTISKPSKLGMGVESPEEGKPLRRQRELIRDCAARSAGGRASSAPSRAICAGWGAPLSRHAASRETPARKSAAARARAASGSRSARGGDPQQRSPVGDVEGGVEAKLALGDGIAETPVGQRRPNAPKGSA